MWQQQRVQLSYIKGCLLSYMSGAIQLDKNKVYWHLHVQYPNTLENVHLNPKVVQQILDRQKSLICSAVATLNLFFPPATGIMFFIFPPFNDKDIWEAHSKKWSSWKVHFFTKYHYMTNCGMLLIQISDNISTPSINNDALVNNSASS